MTGPGFWPWPGWGIVVGLLSFAVWILVIVLIVALVRGRPAGARAIPTSALRILEERYARGEINQEEFIERRRVLRGEAPPPGT